MPRKAWIERTWEFDYPADLYPCILERLRGTPARIAELVSGLSPEVLVRSDGESWSIQRNVGHLLDLEELPNARLDDFLAGKEVGVVSVSHPDTSGPAIRLRRTAHPLYYQPGRSTESRRRSSGPLSHPSRTPEGL